MNLIRLFRALPVIGFVTVTAYADDAGPAPDGGPVAAACSQDVQTLCPGVQHGGGRVMACLKSHAAEVSIGCKAAIKQARARHGQQSSGNQPAAATPTN